MTGRYLLAIDAGTGSCRAVLFTEAGAQVAAGKREWVHREPPGVPGGQDFDVTAGWRAVGECVRDALGAVGAAGADVAAVAATSMREGMVLFDRADREIWACPNVDSRASAEAEDLIREGAAAKIYAEAGDWVSITAPARLRWLARHEPAVLAATGRLGMLSDWIVYRLTGAARHRTLLRVKLGHVRAGRPALVAVHHGAVPGCRPRCSPRSSTPARWSARSARRRPRRPGCARAPRWSRAAPTPSSACSGPARHATSTPWWAARSGRTRCCSPSR